MKVSLLFIISSLITLIHCKKSYGKIRLQSWNLRYDSKKDGVQLKDTIDSLNGTLPVESEIMYYQDYKEVAWSRRRIGIANDVVFNNVDCFCVNEALYNQVEDLKSLLNQLDEENWEYIGVGRIDGNVTGEFEAIFYNTLKVSLEDSMTIWLSNTPFEPSKYPGSSYRTATVGKFKTKSHRKHFTLMNTHLDDKSNNERILGSLLLKQLGAYEYMKGKGPVFLVGDFNSNSQGSDSSSYKISTNPNGKTLDLSSQITINETFAKKYSSSISDTFQWNDFLVETPVIARSGHYSTFTGFEKAGNYSHFDGRIDFQFYGDPNSDLEHIPVKNVSVIRHRVGENFYDMEFHLSDHRPLISDVLIY